jgi:cellulose biosynthesis protein BcsQ
MKILALGNPKGGVGKSTAAVSLAGYFCGLGLKVWLIDLDDGQNSAHGTAQTHVDPLLRQLKCLAYDVPPLRDLRSDADVVVVDLPGREENRMKEALEVCNLLLVPVSASIYEVWQVEKMAMYVAFEQARRRKAGKPPLTVRALVNQYQADDPLNQQLNSGLADCKMAALENTFRQLRGFKRAISQGLLPRLSEHVHPRDRKVIAQAEKDVRAVGEEVLSLLSLKGIRK